MHRIDLFGKPISGFSIQNKQKITTVTGGFMTLMITAMMLMYGVGKFRQLATKSNPLITQAILQNEYDSSTLVDLNDKNFRLAFAAQGQFDGKSRDDEKYVKWYARLSGQKDGIEINKPLPFHRCTEEDLDDFNPVIGYQASILEQVKSDPEKSMFCLEWDEDDHLIINGNG